MIFSELSLAETDTGLTYDRDRAALIGKKLGFGVVVSDEQDEYSVKIFAETPFKHEKAIAEIINELGESLSKNTINSQDCEYGFVEVRLNKNCLLQENLVLLIDFLDKLTEQLNTLGIKGAEPVLPTISHPEPKKPDEKNIRKINLKFDFNSIKGLIGALVATFAMTFIASISVKFNPDSANGFAHIGAYVLSGVSTLLIFFDYRFLAKKIDAFGIIVCPLLSIATAFLSSITVGAKSAALVTKTTFAEGFALLGKLYDISPDLAAFVEGYLINTLVVSVMASILTCVVYFNRHPDEMFNNEIIVKNDDKNRKK